VRPHFEEELMRNVGPPCDLLVYIEASIPSDTASGKGRVSVANAQGEVSPDYEIELTEALPLTPKVVTVRNGLDYQTDVYARGPKSLLRLFVAGLDDSANCNNVKVKIGKHVILPTFVGFVTDIASFQVDAQLPDDISPGITVLKLLFGDVVSEAVEIEISG
jgi:hypothetical protein